MFNLITRISKASYKTVCKRYAYRRCFCILNSGEDKQ